MLRTLFAAADRALRCMPFGTDTAKEKPVPGVPKSRGLMPKCRRMGRRCCRASRRTARSLSRYSTTSTCSPPSTFVSMKKEHLFSKRHQELTRWMVTTIASLSKIFICPVSVLAILVPLLSLPTVRVRKMFFIASSNYKIYQRKKPKKKVLSCTEIISCHFQG